ncbi:MAG: hypothetical protein EOM54_04735 [Clostridia bacterium]|nr:hypothetical protein [Clostridia bacterium]
MKNKKLIVLLAALLVIVIAVGAYVLLPIPDTTYEYVPFDLPENFELPDCRLVSLGSATHGNREPVEAAQMILQVLQKTYGDVAFILEENVGDAERMNELHSNHDEKSGWYYGLGIYANQEMEDLLLWLGGAGVRLYGVDIQRIDVTAEILYENLSAQDFPRAEEIPALISDDKETDGQIEAGLALIDDMEAYLAGRLEEGAIAGRDYDFILHLADTVKMHYEYVSGGSENDTRDRMMAENTLWVMEHEAKCYGNEHCLLFASNGHVLEDPYKMFNGKYEGTPMGYYLSERLGDDYYTIITEARRNVFAAYNTSNQSGTGKIFAVERTGDLMNEYDLDDTGVLFLTSETLLEDGFQQWDMTAIGWYFRNSRSQNPIHYTMSTEISTAFNAMLLFNQLTPSNDLPVVWTVTRAWSTPARSG